MGQNLGTDAGEADGEGSKPASQLEIEHRSA